VQLTFVDRDGDIQSNQRRSNTTSYPPAKPRARETERVLGVLRHVSDWELEPVLVETADVARKQDPPALRHAVEGAQCVGVDATPEIQGIELFFELDAGQKALGLGRQCFEPRAATREQQGVGFVDRAARTGLHRQRRRRRGR